jgi:Xaa-Pro aminopeptidase
MRKIFITTILILFFFLSILSISTHAQRTELPREEFMKRRTALMEQVKKGMIILFANAESQPGAHFRQDNDFYYFTGIEDMNAILVMIPGTREAVLFLPQQSAREELFLGKNLLGDPNAKEKTGLTNINSLGSFKEYMSQNVEKAEKTFYIRLSPQDTVDRSRWETVRLNFRKARNPYNTQTTLDLYRNKKLEEQYPKFEMKDVVPFIDTLRLIKTPGEIEILRRNGKISAEAIEQAMRATRPGAYEYELEAVAVHVILKNGARGVAYPPIVGSGPNSCIMHYNKNGRRMEAGDIILMDFGADLDYLCMDITRTWPVSGKFTQEQRKIYQTVLEVQKACIEAYRPGITFKEVQEHVADVMKKKKINPRGLKGGMHHYVGMATHDVGMAGIPLKEGMVFTIEPGLYYSEKNLGIRIEDTVLITKDGCEVLSKDVPKEIDEIEALMAGNK